MTPAVPADPPDAEAVRDQDQPRTARLIFDAELAAGVVAPEALQTPAVLAATRVRRVPARGVRAVEQIRYKLGRLSFESAVIDPLLAARRAVLGEHCAAPPRFLIRVDEFPHFRAWDDPDRFGVAAFERFAAIMSDARVPYLLAVLPRVSHDPLSPGAGGSRPLEQAEVAMLGRMGAEGVGFGLHGRDHRTRFASPRRHSELCGLARAETRELLEAALAELAGYEIRPDVFVPPYNRFDAGQLDALAQRFSVVCGGPESIGTMGFQSTPQWRSGTVYLPSYAPVYGRAAEVLGAVEQLIERAVGLWVPVVLHWGWEAQDGWGELERLAQRIAPYASRWEDFRAAIERSRGNGAGLPSERGQSPASHSDQARGTPAVSG